MNELPHIVRERLTVKNVGGGDHPDPNLLAAFAERVLPDRERTPLLAHLALCADCRDVLALSTPPLETEHLAIKDTGGARTAPWFRWPILRWGTLAACVVIVGTAVLLQRDSRKQYLARDIAPSSLPAVVSSMPPVSQDDASSHNREVVAPPPQEKAKQAVAPQVPDQVRSLPIQKDKEVVVTGQQVSVLQVPSLNSRSSAESFAIAPGLDKLARNTTKGDRLQGGTSGGIGAGMGSAPAPVAAPTAPKSASGNLPIESRNFDQMKIPSSSETVEVEAAAPVAPIALDAKVASTGRAKGAPSSNYPAPATAPQPDQSDAAIAKTGAKARDERSIAYRVEVTRWTISSHGQLQRSIDSGKTWLPVTVTENALFRALSANGPDVWVGGAAGLLYHTADAGAHWSQVKPAAGSATLTADIAAIEFTDLQHGKITTASGQIWLTTDAGQTWQTKN